MRGLCDTLIQPDKGEPIRIEDMSREQLVYFYIRAYTKGDDSTMEGIMRYLLKVKEITEGTMNDIEKYRTQQGLTTSEDSN